MVSEIKIRVKTRTKQLKSRKFLYDSKKQVCNPFQNF
jgi:hypothetical protein